MNSILHKIQSTGDVLTERLGEYISKNVPETTLGLGEWRIFNCQSLVSENYHASPSIFIRQFGHWTIARLDNGDAACLDSKSGVIRIFDTGAFTGKKDNQGFVMPMPQSGNKKPMREPCNAENILLFVKQTFGSLDDFRKKLDSGY